MSETYNCPLCKDTGWIELENGSYKRCVCRNQINVQSLIDLSGIPKGYLAKTVADYNASDKLSNEIKKAVTDYVNNFKQAKESGLGLYLYSQTAGTGKTHLACAVGLAVMRLYQVNVKFITLSDLFLEIQSAFKGDFYSVLNNFRDAELLIIDDVGVEKPSEWKSEMMFSIVDYREKNVLPTIMTSNCRKDELSYDNRIKSRIKVQLELQAPMIDRRSL